MREKWKAIAATSADPNKLELRRKSNSIILVCLNRNFSQKKLRIFPDCGAENWQTALFASPLMFNCSNWESRESQLKVRLCEAALQIRRY